MSYIQKLKRPCCPQCGSDEVAGHTVVSGFSTVCMKTLTAEIPDDVDCDFFDIYEFSCGFCDHEWEDDTNEQIKREYYEQLIKRRVG